MRAQLPVEVLSLRGSRGMKGKGIHNIPHLVSRMLLKYVQDSATVLHITCVFAHFITQEHM